MPRRPRGRVAVAALTLVATPAVLLSVVAQAAPAPAPETEAGPDDDRVQVASAPVVTRDGRHEQVDIRLSGGPGGSGIPAGTTGTIVIRDCKGDLFMQESATTDRPLTQLVSGWAEEGNALPADESFSWAVTLRHPGGTPYQIQGEHRPAGATCRTGDTKTAKKRSAVPSAAPSPAVAVERIQRRGPVRQLKAPRGWRRHR